MARPSQRYIKDRVTTADLFQIKCIGDREFACIDFEEDEHYITFTSIETGKEIKLFKDMIRSINMYKDCYPVSIS